MYTDAIFLNLSISEDIENVGSIAIVKCNDAPLKFSEPLCSQVSVMTMRVRSQPKKAVVPLSAPSSLSYTDNSALSIMQRHAQYSFAPLVRLTANSASQSSHVGANEIDNLTLLQKKLREVTLALEQCQHSTTIPYIKLPVPEVLEEICLSQDISNTDLKQMLEKYVPSKVDPYLEEIGLIDIMGKTDATKEKFANDVSSKAKDWPDEISKQTKLLDSTFPKSVSKEIEFWKDFSVKISDTKSHLEGAPRLLTKLVLKRTNRISEEIVREAETNLEKAVTVVEGSYSFVRDFPIELVLSANDICPDLETAVAKCLRHFTKLKFASAGYDLLRASRLLSALGSEVHHRLLAILQDRKVMKISLEDFLTLHEQCQQFFRVWDQEFTSVRNVLTDIEKRKGIKLKMTTVPEHATLQERLKVLSKFPIFIILYHNVTQSLSLQIRKVP